MFFPITCIIQSAIDPKVYSGIGKDALLTFFVFLSSLIFLLFFTYSFNGVNFLLDFLGYDPNNTINRNLLIWASILILPVLVSLIFFLFKSESRFLSLAAYGLEIIEPSKASNFSLFLYFRAVLLLIAFYVFTLFPYIGIFFSSLILAFDCAAYVFEALGLRIGDQFSFIFRNYLSSFLIGLVVLSLSLIPFGFFISYPVGVLAMAKLYKKINRN